MSTGVSVVVVAAAGIVVTIIISGQIGFTVRVYGISFFKRGIHSSGLVLAHMCRGVCDARAGTGIEAVTVHFFF